MNYNQAIRVSEAHLLPEILALYGFKSYAIKSIGAHEGGRNLVYECNKNEEISKIIRIAFLCDRTYEDICAEVEFVRYLAENGASVSNVVGSLGGKLVEKISYEGHIFYVSVFEYAKGKQLAENGYQYRDGVPLSEYYFKCGKVLGKIHQLSKEYSPKFSRFSFFDKFNKEYIDELIPNSLALLKTRMFELLNSLAKLDDSRESYGLIHFDYSDGNYNIDFETGEITVYDFDNCCYGWYLYDLASLWTHGVGWVQFEQNSHKRKEFMDDYFSTVLNGYRSETSISDFELEKLPLLINANIMENIVDEFEVSRRNGEEPECDEVMAYLAKCLEDNIPYQGFFSEIYSTEAPFEYEARKL